MGIGVADSVWMLENSIYSVISPEGCASILFKDSKKAPEAARSLGIDAFSLKTMGIIDGIINEPLGGAHRDYDEMAKSMKNVIIKELKKLEKIEIEKLLENRYNKFRRIGEFFE